MGTNTERIDILFPAWNRLAFTEASLKALVAASTERERIVVYLDRGEQDMKKDVHKILRPNDVCYSGKWGSPVAIMNDFLKRAPGPSDIFCKVDNDLVVCPGWIDVCLKAMEKQPGVDFVGIEPFSAPAPLEEERRLRPAKHIGGIGVFRRRAFEGKAKPVPAGRFGFTRWQVSHPEVKKAWLSPPLPVFLLDHLSFDPWKRLSERYRVLGWERKTGGRYGENLRDLWSWWTQDG